MSTLASSMYSPNEYIYIICKQTCYIKQLRRSGPISNPLKVKVSVAYNIVLSGVKIYQYDPATKKVVLLTIFNVFKRDKFETTASVAASTFSMTRNVEEPVEGETDETPVETGEEKVEAPSATQEEKTAEETVTASEDNTEDKEPVNEEEVVETPIETVEEATAETEEESEEEEEAADEAEAETAAVPTQNTNTSGGKKKKKKKNNNNTQHVEG